MKATLIGKKLANAPSAKNGKYWDNLSFVFKDRNSDSGSWAMAFVVERTFLASVESDLGCPLKSGEIYNIEKDGRYLIDISAAD